jgi:ribosomal protein S18 acetylase RimI-like enzyme
MNRLTVRAAAEADIALQVALIAEAFTDVAERFGLTRENCPAHTSFITEDEIRVCLGFGTVFHIAQWEGRPCGCVAVRRPKNGRSAIEKVAVLPQFRRHGIGRALVEEAFADARKSGAAFADIGIIAAHTELRSWYEKFGFKSVRQTHYDHLPFDVLHLERDLKAP